MNEVPIKEVYERFKHMDKLLTDLGFVTTLDEDGRTDPYRQVLYSLWGAVKAAVEGRP